MVDPGWEGRADPQELLESGTLMPPVFLVFLFASHLGMSLHIDLLPSIAWHSPHGRQSGP